jgi:hypothetical protein
MKGWKTKTGAALLAIGSVAPGIADACPNPEMATWILFAGKLLQGLGAALTAYGIGHKIEKASNGKQ